MSREPKQTIQVSYVSGLYTTLIPSLVFLATMALFVYGTFEYFDLMDGVDERSALADIGIGVGNLIGSVLAGIIVVIPTQKLLIAMARLKKRPLTIKGAVLEGGGARIDLSQPHSALIGAGVAPNDQVLTLINIQQEGQYFHISLEDMVRDKSLEHFGDERFVVQSVLGTEYGNAGYECSKEDPSHTEFMATILEVLFAHIEQNTRYQLFATFPWDKVPKPETSYIERVRPEDERIRTRVVDAEVTNDRFDVIGDYALVRGHVGGEEGSFWVPLGHSLAEIKEIHYAAPTTTAVAFKQKEACVVRGRNERGEGVEINVAPMPADFESKEYLELSYFAQFINEMAVTAGKLE